MKRFIENPVSIVPIQETDQSMERSAKMNIRKKLIESALSIGVVLNLSEQPQTQPPDPMAPYIDILKSEEGFKTKMYKDTKGIPTIGVGFNLNRPDAKNVFQKCFGDQCDDVYSRANDPNKGMSEAEVEKLTRYDLENTFLPRTKKLVKNFDDLPETGRTHLVSSTWRGSLPGSPKTLGLLNAGKYDAAANEYLDNQEYRESKVKKTGVYKRMDREAEAIRSLGQQKPITPPVNSTPTAQPASTQPQAPQKQDSGEEYEIQKGDTLSGISKRTGRSVEDIARENKIADPNKIGVGQRIRIPRG